MKQRMIFRMILTVLFFMVFTVKNNTVKLYNKNINVYLFLPIALIFLDIADTNVPKLFFELKKDKNGDEYGDEYHIYDKITDSLSYLYVWYLLKLDIAYLYIILFRMIGVYQFVKNNNTSYLVYFPDFFKECILYSYFFKDPKYLPIVFIGKYIFEYSKYKLNLF